jgi:hypothetical protein
MGEGQEAQPTKEITMSNSSRIEKATREHVGAVLTSTQIAELVKLSDPTNTKGIYPSDAAGKLLEDGTITHRGKVAYGDLVLLHMGTNSFKVLATEQIVRRPGSKKAVPVPVDPPVVSTPKPTDAAVLPEVIPPAPPALKNEWTKETTTKSAKQAKKSARLAKTA